MVIKLLTGHDAHLNEYGHPNLTNEERYSMDFISHIVSYMLVKSGTFPPTLAHVLCAVSAVK